MAIEAGRKLLSGRVSDNGTDGFDETISFKILHCSNVDGNNNKFYSIELQKNSQLNQLRLFSNYGRLGISQVFEVRDKWKEDKTDLMSDQLAIVEKEMDAIVRKKLKGKLVKHGDEKIRETYHEVDVAVPKVGSPNIMGKNFGTEVKITTKNVKKSASDDNVNSNIRELINLAIEENIHNVTSATSITYNNGSYETPLGPLTQDQIDKARKPLNEIKQLLMVKTSDEELKRFNNLYFSLIPHDFGRQISKEDWISEFDQLSDEYEILDQLESAINLGVEMNDGISDIMSSMGITLEMAHPDEHTRIDDKFESNRAHNHGNLRDWKIKNVFDATLKDERKRYDDCSVGGREVELFHGSRNCNILSIMSGGLIIPHVAAHGRMFGNGIYAAPASTKALNYSTGFWGGKNKYPQAFVFVVKMTLGKEYSPTKSIWGGPPSGHDSVWAEAKKSSLYNDEVIVYGLDQCTITHVIELTKRR